VQQGHGVPLLFKALHPSRSSATLLTPGYFTDDVRSLSICNLFLPRGKWGGWVLALHSSSVISRNKTSFLSTCLNHVQSMWAERERRKSRSGAPTYFCNPHSCSVPTPRSAPAPSFSATLAPRSTPLRSAPPDFRPVSLRFQLRSRSTHAPLTCSDHVLSLPDCIQHANFLPNFLPKQRHFVLIFSIFLHNQTSNASNRFQKLNHFVSVKIEFEVAIRKKNLDSKLKKLYFIVTYLQLNSWTARLLNIAK